MKLLLSSEACDDNLEGQKWDRKILSKINSLIFLITFYMFEGSSQPEPLKRLLSWLWSRCIDAKNRLVYQVKDNVCLIVQCKGLYGDK